MIGSDSVPAATISTIIADKRCGLLGENMRNIFNPWGKQTHATPDFDPTRLFDSYIDKNFVLMNHAGLENRTDTTLEESS